MKVIKPETRIEVRHFFSTFDISKKKKTDAASIAIHPTKKAGAKLGLLWKLIAASVFMLVTGYIGEAIYPTETQSWIWGFVSSIGYFYIVYLIWFGDREKVVLEKQGVGKCGFGTRNKIADYAE